jgi:hypothetical protein
MGAQIWWSVLLDQYALDRDLAEGRRPEAAAELSLRARQLQRRRTRRALAGTIEGLVDAARRPPAMMAGIRPRRSAVLEASGSLLALADRLRSSRPVTPRGVALAGVLLTSPSSPVYSPRAARTIDEWASEALRALEPRERDAAACLSPRRGAQAATGVASNVV